MEAPFLRSFGHIWNQCKTTDFLVPIQVYLKKENLPLFWALLRDFNFLFRHEKAKFHKNARMNQKLYLQKCFGILFYIRNRLNFIIFCKKPQNHCTLLDTYLHDILSLNNLQKALSIDNTFGPPPSLLYFLEVQYTYK